MSVAGNMTPTIRGLVPSDMDRFADLCAARGAARQAADGRAALVEHLAFRNPVADGNPTYFVIEVAGRLMGHIGRMPAMFQVAGERQLAAYIHDLFVHDELDQFGQVGQASALATELHRRAVEASKSFSVLLWPGDLGLESTRTYHAMRASRYVKLLRADAKLEEHVPVAPLVTLGKPLAALALAAVDRVRSQALGARRRPRDRIVEIDRFDDRFDRFSSRMRNRLGICPVKDQAYLGWKYTDRPDVETARFAAVDGTGELIGFVVVAVPARAPHEACILELCADPEDPDTILSLVDQAVEHARKAHAHTIQCMGTDPRFAAVLRKLLFAPRPPDEPIFLAGIERCHEPALLEDVASWHISFGDAESPV